MLSIDLVEFSAEFVETARKCIDEAPGIKKEIFTNAKMSPRTWIEMVLMWCFRLLIL